MVATGYVVEQAAFLTVFSCFACAFSLQLAVEWNIKRNERILAEIMRRTGFVSPSLHVYASPPSPKGPGSPCARKRVVVGRMNFYFNRLGLAASVLLVLRYIDPYGHSGTVPIRVSIWLTDNASALLITTAAIALYLPIDLVFRISFSKPAPRSYMYLLAISAVFSLCGANVYVWVQGAPFNYFLLILAVTITSFMTLFTVYFFRLRRALSVAHLLPGSSASGAPGLPTSPTHSRNQRRTTPPSQLATAGTCSLSDRESDRSTSFEFTPPPPAVHQPKCSAEVARALRHLSVLYVGFFAVTAICVPLQVYFMAVGSNAVRAPTGDQYPSNLSESHTPFSLVQAMALALYLYFGRLPLSELCHREQPISLAIASGRAHTQGLATAHVPKTLTAASTQSGKSAVTPPALAVLDVASGGGGGGGANVRLMSAVINPTDDSAGESIRVVTVLLESESASGHTPRATTVKLSELQPAQCHAMAGAPFECGRVHAHGHAGHEPGQPSSDSLHMPQLT